MLNKSYWLCSLAVSCLAASAAAVSLDMVSVGNPGNPGQLSGYGAPGGWGGSRVCGAVDYTYNIGTFEVTAGQYTEFLNAVARTDTYGLYSPYMWYYPNRPGTECKISRTGTPGTYAYSVAAQHAGKPVNFVSWGDAARFCNWLTNGQPTGPQSLATTEDGSYRLDGANTEAQLAAVTRRPDAHFVIPTEDEWYKAAYHKNNGPTGDYWDYPTASDVRPGIALPDTGNNANFLLSGIPVPITAGSYVNSASPYGTFDQAGNVWEWTETFDNGWRTLRGGACSSQGDSLRAGYRYFTLAPENFPIGFRVVEIPEPGTLILLAAAGLAMARRTSTRRRLRQDRSVTKTGAPTEPQTLDLGRNSDRDMTCAL